MIRVDGQQYWLYAAIDPDTDEVLHIELYTGPALLFFRGLKARQKDAYAEFLVDGAQWLHTALRRHSLRFQPVTHGNRNAIERLYKEIKRRTRQFSNHFRHANPDIGTTWLHAQAFCQKQPI